MATASPNKSYLKSINALRGIGALIVILFHMQLQMNGLFLQDHPVNFMSQSYLAVDFFFAISGFIISHIYYDAFSALTPKTYWSFICNRFVRIYPVHITTILVIAGFELVRLTHFHGGANPPFSQGTGLYELFSNLLLIQAWHLHPYLSWNYPAWSISGEWFAYLLAPLLIGRIAKHFNKTLPLLGLYIVCAGIFVTLGHYLGTFDITYNFGTIRTLLGFTMGVALYGVYLKLSRATLKINYDWLVCGVVVLAACLSYWQAPIIFSILTHPVIILLCALSSGWVYRLLTRKPLFYLGEISYSAYMTHGLVVNQFFNIFYKKMPHPTLLQLGLAMAFLLLLCLVVAHFTFQLIEDPARIYFKKLMTEKKSRNQPIVSNEIIPGENVLAPLPKSLLDGTVG